MVNKIIKALQGVYQKGLTKQTNPFLAKSGANLSEFIRTKNEY
jgi:hypothetical protein